MSQPQHSKEGPDPLPADQALVTPPFGGLPFGLALVATNVPPVEAAIDPVAATIEPPIDSVALPVEMTGGPVVALIVRAIRRAIEPALLDTIATIGTLETIPVRRVILSQRRSARDGQRQR